jgi:hypothetical protein
MSKDLVDRLEKMATVLIGQGFRSMDDRLIALELLQAKNRIEELMNALRQCHTALEVAFDYDADVFGIHHNDAVDAIMEAERLLGIKR